MFTLNPRNFGIAAGLVWGLALMAMTWLSIATGYGFLFLSMLVDLYPGYSISLSGSLLGLFYGFLDGFILFWLIAWIYNFLEH